MLIKLKDVLQKVKDGEDLTAEEQEVVDNADKKAEEEEVDAQAEALSEKLMAILAPKLEAAKSADATDVKSFDKDAFKSMTGTEKSEVFFKAVIKNDLATLKYLNESSDENGGYLVPDETFSEIVNELAKVTVMRSNARVIPNCPAHLDISGLTTLPTPQWRGEAAKKQSSTVIFGTQALTPYSVAVLVVLTNELKEDSMIDITSFITDAMVEALSEEEDVVFAKGNGTGKPSGLEHYYAAYPAARKVLNATIADIGDRVVAADSRLKPKYRPAAKWYMPQSQLEKIRILRAAATGQFLFQPDPTGAFVGTLCGKPVMLNDNLTNIWFGDLGKAYWIGQRGGLRVAQSTEATIGSVNLFENNMFALRVEERIDGELVSNMPLIAIEAE